MCLDFLYGDMSGRELPLAFDDLSDYAALDSWTAQDWQRLLSEYVTDLIFECLLIMSHRYYVSAECITVIGKPSAALSKKIEEEEKLRIVTRQNELGKDKLKELESALEQAKKESEAPPPADMIASFPLTDVSGLRADRVISGLSGT